MMEKISNNNPMASLGRAEASRKPKPALGNPQEAQQNDPGFEGSLLGANIAQAAPVPVPAGEAATKPEASNTAGPAAKTTSLKGESSGEDSLMKMEAKRISPKVSGLFDRPGQGAEASPNTLAAAVSMNTAAAIAGPRPWGKEWVFSGYDRNPEIKPLIPEKAPTGAQLLQEAGMREGGEAAGAQKPVGLMQAMQELAKVEGDLKAARLAGENPEGAASQAAARDSSSQTATQNASELQALAQQHSQSQLSQIIGNEGLNGGDGGEAGFEGAEIIDTRGFQPAHKPIKTGGPVANANLSGGEYLSTLAALKGGQQTRHDSLAGQWGGDSQQGRDSGLAMSGQKLKMIDGGFKGKMKGGFEENLALSGAPAGLVAHGGNPAEKIAAITPEVAGHVVKGAGSKDRLSSESLMNITQSVQKLTPEGGGEMRVRLRPDNLGELHVKVVTEGNRVGLQIQASDEHARKVLEESISHLKTSLAAQHLSLSTVDVTVAQPSQSASSGDFRQDNSSQSQNAFGDMFGQNRNPDSSGEGWTRQGGESLWRDPSASSPRGGNTLRGAEAWNSNNLATGSRRAAVDDQRLDVMA